MEEKNSNFIIKIVVALCLVVFFFGIYNGYNNEKREAEEQVPEKTIAQTFDEPYDDEELQAPETIDVEYFKNKKIELYKLVGKEMPENESEHFNNLIQIEELMEECYENLSEYATTTGVKVDGKTLKDILSEVASFNEKKIEQTDEYNGGAYIRAAISQENSLKNSFKRNGFNDVNVINELIGIIKDENTYYVKVLRKYDLFGILSLRIKVFDNYLENENYVNQDSIRPMRLTSLERELMDVFISDDPVSGEIVKECLDEVISYNSKREDIENGILVSVEGEDDGEKFYEFDVYEIEDLENIKSRIDKNQKYMLSRSSGGLNTEYGYMYSYKISIREVN